MKALLGAPGPEPRSPEQEACQGTQGEGTLPCSGLLGSAPGWAAAAGGWEGLEEGSLGKRVGRNNSLLSTYCVRGPDICYLIETHSEPMVEGMIITCPFYP